MQPRSVVSIVRCPDYSPERVAPAVRDALDLAGLTERFHPGESVLLKPNLLSARSPDEAVTTHPAVIRAVGKVASASGCVLTLGDSPPFAGENAARYARLCELTGAADAARELGADIARFEESSDTITHPTGRFYRNFEIARAVLDADLVVSISKLKTHGLTLFTGAVKNLFGCVPGVRKGLFHVQAAEDREVFAQMLVDLLGALKPGTHVMDAIVGMEGEGPNAGAPKPVGLILASSDPVALDAVACEIVGIEPHAIATTRLAHAQGLGCGNPEMIEVRGESVESVRVRDFRESSGRNDWSSIPAPIRKLLRRQLVARPRIRSEECVGCGDCVRVCPVQAITPGKPPTIDLDACIRCYCCHEVCNLSAVELRKGLLGRLLSGIREKR